MPIRARILLGCLALTVLTGLLGLYAQRAESRLGSVGLDIYDKAFMAVTYLREAQLEFAALAGEAASRHAAPASGPGGAGPDILDDLDLVRERAMSGPGRAQAIALRARVAALLPHLDRDAAGAASARQGFDRLVEIFADDGYRDRRRVSELVRDQQRQTWVAILASLIAAMAITSLISHLIVPPVRRAVRIAQSIAAGRLDNPIGQGDRGETGDLLRALAIMQAAIAAAMARIEALLAEQTETHASALAIGHARLEAALENMSQGLCLFGADGRLLVANRRFAEMFGAPEPGGSSSAVLRAAGLGGVLPIASGGGAQTLSCELPTGRSIAVSQRAVMGGGWVATYEDVSERREAERRLLFMARHDTLTGLPNRLTFAEHVTSLLAEHRRAGAVAILSINLDRFRPVNESLGHEAGDAVLVAVAERLRGCAGPSDLVVRLEGDGFSIVQDAAAQPEAARTMAERVAASLAFPIGIGQDRVTLGASIGIALTEPGLATPEALLQSADLAMRRAKRDGRGGFCFFEAEMDARMQARRILEHDLRRAVADQQFELFYQPLMSGLGGVSGFEALVRWRHPERGLIFPTEFITVAEETGLIPSIGSWVLRRACTEAASWPKPLKVAVNLSPLQFQGPLVREIAEAVAASGLDPRRLEVEITESLLLQNDEMVLATLQAIRRLGVRVAMDDFGTGYSSIGYLRRFPFDKLKIDQSFVCGLDGGTADRKDCLAIIRAVIGLGRALGMLVNAEGVETQAQRDMLLAEGCDELQGYLFSRPQPASEVPLMLLGLGSQAIARGTHPCEA